MAYRYEPGTADAEKLCALLEAKCPPRVKCNFNIEGGGLLRLKMKFGGNYFEKLLREVDTPEMVVDAALKALGLPNVPNDIDQAILVSQ